VVFKSRDRAQGNTLMDPLQVGLPASLDLERFVLGSILIDDHAFQEIRGTLASEDFSLERHRRIYLHMASLYDAGEHIDRVTLASSMSDADQLGSDGVSYICSLDEGLPALENLDGYVRIVREKATLRRTIMQCQSLIDRCLMQHDAPGDVLADAERAMRELGGDVARNSDQMQSFGDILTECGGINAFGAVPAPGIPLPYAGLQRALDGIRPGELIVLGARPSSGKSAAAGEIAIYAAERGYPGAFFSLEVGGRAMLTRAIANRAQIDSRDIRRGRLKPLERESMARELRGLVKLPLWINTRARTVAAIHAATRKAISKQKLSFIVVDHLHLLGGNAKRQDNRNRELDQMTAELKLMAGELDIAVLLLSQLNRSHETEKRPPEMRDLRECGSIEANADVIVFLHRKDQVQDEASQLPFAPVDMILAKQREGVTYLKFPMLLFGKYSQFVEDEQRRTA
jgi:replicative DNA helicase